METDKGDGDLVTEEGGIQQHGRKGPTEEEGMGRRSWEEEEGEERRRGARLGSRGGPWPPWQEGIGRAKKGRGGHGRR